MANFERIENNDVKFNLTISAEEFEKGVQKAYQKNRKRFSVPGFRKGKVSRKMIQRHYGEGVFYEDAFEEVYWEVYIAAVEQANLTPVDSPNISIEQIEEGKELKFTATVSVKPEPKVDISTYKDIEITEISTRVTKVQVDKKIQQERERQARYVEVNREIQQNDRVGLDYSGSVEDVKFEGGTAEAQTLDIGSGSFIPGFEEQLIGLKTGDQKQIRVTFPVKYHAEDLAGKEAIFDVKINDIKEKELPEVDDEFAKDVSDFDTLKEYQDDLKKELSEAAKANAKSNHRQQAIDKIVENVPFDLPNAMVERQIDRMMEEMRYRLAPQGLELEQYFGFMGIDVNQAREQMRVDAEKRVRANIILEGIVKNEHIEVNDEKIDEEVQKLAESIHKTEEETKQMLSQADMDAIKYDISEQLALDWVMDHAVFIKKKKSTTKIVKKEVDAPEEEN